MVISDALGNLSQEQVKMVFLREGLDRQRNQLDQTHSAKFGFDGELTD
jgi:hypothetical protein